ncbi:hypothetical protein ABZ357_38740 [Streptomyces sp. NPDC005917]
MNKRPVRTAAVHPTHQGADQAVDRLAEKGCPVRETAIAGQDVQPT